MDNIKPVEQNEIDTKIKEAETCHSMGMMHEALQVYEQVHAVLSDRDGQIRMTIGTKINQLKKELEVQEEADNGSNGDQRRQKPQVFRRVAHHRVGEGRRNNPDRAEPRHRSRCVLAS